MSLLALRLLSQDRGSRTGSQPGMFRQPERDKPSRDCVLNPSLLRPIRLRAASSFSGRTYNTTEHNKHQAQYLKLAKLARTLRLRGPASNARRMQLFHARIARTSTRQGRRRPRAGAGLALLLPGRGDRQRAVIQGLEWERGLYLQL